MNNYYKILGVTSEAEDIVIKAAYRALAQRYHPDRWNGDPSDATKRMAAINEAYEVLSNPVKRKLYDNQRGDSGFEPDPENQSAEKGLSDELDEKWKIACEYFPDLPIIARELERLSSSLAFTYKLTLLETQKIKERCEVAASIEDQYLRKYFGNNSSIKKYARSLILSGRKPASLELNKAVCVFGEDIDPKIVIEKIERKWPIKNNAKNEFSSVNTIDLRKMLIHAIEYGPQQKLAALAKAYAYRLNSKVELVEIEMPYCFIFTTNVTHFKVTQFGFTNTMNEEEFMNWVKKDPI